jgi:integrase
MPRRSEIEFDENTVRTNHPRDTRYQLRDRLHKGLILRVLPTGTKSWLVEVERNVIRKVGDANSMTLAKARTKATRMQGEHSSGKKIKSSRLAPPTLKKFIEGRYAEHMQPNKSGEADVARLLSACSPLLSTRMDKLKEEQIESWKKSREKVVAKSTVHRDLATLRHALTLAVRWKIIEENPAGNGKDGVKVTVPEHHRVRYLNDDERKALLDALNERDQKRAAARRRNNERKLKRGETPLPEITGFADYLHPMVLLAMHTGLRRGEMFSLTWDNVELDGKTPKVTVLAGNAKSNKTRYVNLNSTIVDVLKRWQKQSSSEGLVFPNPVTGTQLKKLKTSWPALMKKAGIKDFRFHDLRHDFASQLVRARVDLYRVRDLLGHHSITMTEKYAHLTPEALAEAVEVLAQTSETDGRKPIKNGETNG